MKHTPQTLKGFRDFLPTEKKIRDYVKEKIEQTFKLFAFEPLETPTLEYASLLLGKYGDEADKLVYSFEDRGKRKIALRYDQTVPTARILAQYKDKLPKYFRRYQIQNVFRADKPQKGRYREFTQCDCDIFNTGSTVADAELLAVCYFSYKNLGFNSIKLHLNDREVLIDTLQKYQTDKVTVLSIIQSIDKLDKLSIDKVTQELINKGLAKTQAQALLNDIQHAETSTNLQTIINQAVALGVDKDSLVFTPILARGLDYYTGMIFEVIIPQYTGGSVGGGGRYNNLINQLSGHNIKATGFAIGFDRTVEAVKELGLLPSTVSGHKQVLVTVMNEAMLPYSLKIASTLRNQGIATQIYPELDKLTKQLKMANKQKITFAIIIGEEEVANNKMQLKNMVTGEQQLLTLEDLVNEVKNFSY